VRLRDLDAEFCGDATERGFRRRDEIAGAQGIMFQCPKCAEGKERGEEGGRRFVRGAHYILCWFSNPREAPTIPAEWYKGIARWEMTGTSLDDVTLRPSILVQGPGCGFHGFITNGDVHL